MPLRCSLECATDRGSGRVKLLMVTTEWKKVLNREALSTSVSAVRLSRSIMGGRELNEVIELMYL